MTEMNQLLLLLPFLSNRYTYDTSKTKVLLLYLKYEQFSFRYNKHFQNKGHYSGLILELNSDPEKWPFLCVKILIKGGEKKMDTEIPKNASGQNTIFDDVFRTIAEKLQPSPAIFFIHHFVTESGHLFYLSLIFFKFFLNCFQIFDVRSPL